MKWIWNSIKEDWQGLVLYILFAGVLNASGVGALDNPLGFLALLGILMVVDVRSYSRGLRK